MTEGEIILLFAFGFLNGQLKLALNFTHKEIIDDDIICWLIQFIFDTNKFKLFSHVLTLIEDIKCFKEANELSLIALEFRSKKISYSKNYKIYWLFLQSWAVDNTFTCFKEMMDEYIKVSLNEKC